MFGMGNNDDEERFWNMVTLHIWATDKEIEEMAPIFLIIIAVVGIIFLIVKCA